MAQIEPSEWVSRLLSQDAQAQGDFFNAHWGEVYAICARILGRGADASDVATDVLVEFMFNYVQKLTRPEALKAYLRLMAVRRSIRLQKKLMHSESSETDSFADESGITPEEEANLRALMPRLGRCLEELTPRSQQVLRLRFKGELVNEKIGAIVGCTKMHVGRIIKSSLELLRECLERSQAAEA